SLAFLELIQNAPARQVEEPRLEPALLWIIDKLREPPRHPDGSFLHHFLGFVRRETGLGGEESDQPAINPVKLLPALRVVAGLEPVQQARPRFERTAVRKCHGGCHSRGLNTPTTRIFQEKSSERSLETVCLTPRLSMKTSDKKTPNQTYEKDDQQTF